MTNQKTYETTDFSLRDIPNPHMAFLLAQGIGLTEKRGGEHDPLILAMHKYGAQATWFATDEIPWCASCICGVARLAGRVNPASARARSFLTVGEHLGFGKWLVEYRKHAEWDTSSDKHKRMEILANTVIILKQRANDPGPNTIKYRGHVGIPVGLTEYNRPDDDGFIVHVLGGNQKNQINIRGFDASLILDMRYLPPTTWI